jgi:hypothetical protein
MLRAIHVAAAVVAVAAFAAGCGSVDPARTAAGGTGGSISESHGGITEEPIPESPVDTSEEEPPKHTDGKGPEASARTGVPFR